MHVRLVWLVLSLGPSFRRVRSLVMILLKTADTVPNARADFIGKSGVVRTIAKHRGCHKKSTPGNAEKRSYLHGRQRTL